GCGGGIWLFALDTWSFSNRNDGSCGASHGASNATSTNTPMIVAPIRNIGLRLSLRHADLARLCPSSLAPSGPVPPVPVDRPAVAASSSIFVAREAITYDPTFCAVRMRGSISAYDRSTKRLISTYDAAPAMMTT